MPKTLTRWNVQTASRELGRHREVISRALRSNGIAPDVHGQYAVRDIVRAVYGDLSRERTRNESALADLREMKRDGMRETLIPLTILQPTLSRVASHLRRVIDASPLPAPDKATCCANVEKLENLTPEK